MTKINARFMGWRPQQNGKQRVTIDIDAADAPKLSELIASGRFISLAIGDPLPPPPLPVAKPKATPGATPLEEVIDEAKAREAAAAPSATLVFAEQAGEPIPHQPAEEPTGGAYLHLTEPAQEPAQEQPATGSPFGEV